MKAGVRGLLLLVAMAAACALQAPPARAADVSPTTVGQVVVQGQRAPKKPETYSTTVRKFVETHARPSPIGTLSRWAAPVCPYTKGLTLAFDVFVTKRIMEDAARFGAPQKPTCKKSNVLVIFTTEPQKIMDDVRGHYPGLLGFHYLPQEKALATFHGPIEAWHVTASRWTSTGSLAVDDPTANARNSATRGSAPMISTWDESRMKLERSNEFFSSLVVIDANRIEGLEIGPIADHIALLVLSDAGRREGCSALPTLLDQMDPDCPDSVSLASFTPYDEAFLEGLYKTRPDQLAGLERGSIMLHVLKDTLAPATELGGPAR